MSARSHKRPPARNAVRICLMALLGAALLMALVSPPADAKVKFKIPGRGYGHGVGMSQWGAYGYAKHGRSHKQILGHYFKGTRLGSAGSKKVRVLLTVRSSSVKFSHARKACGHKLKPGKTYRADLDGKGRNVRLERKNGKKITGCGKKLTAKSKKTIKIKGEGTYRGKLAAVADSGSLNVVNDVPIDAYVKGVVPNEVPASWPAAALRAQAVAARSYALATGVGGTGFDFYDDTRSQVYSGLAGEQPATNAAVKKTSKQVVKYQGDVIPTYFFSSSGGRTENVEHGFPGGSPKPYLKSVKDPYDKASPDHRWTVTYTRAEMKSKLSGLVKGKLRDIEITRTGSSPRIVKAKIIGSGGKSTVSGDDLRFRLGLRSTWAKFKKIK